MTDRSTARRPLRRRLLPAALLGAAAAMATGSSLGPAAHAQGAATAPRGKAVYDAWCAGCHGDTGAGDGPAANRMLPRPRDFTKGVYQIRTTASGELPTDDDLRHVVAEGMPGTAMPEWKSVLSESEREDVIAYIKSFSAFFQQGAAPKRLELGNAPGRSDAGIADGKAVYRKMECFKCHGDSARGDGNSAPTLKDDLNQPIRAADLTAGWKFNGGNSVEAIHTRLRTGLDGTPMPTYSDALESKLVTEEELWHLAQYIHSLSPEGGPQVREVVRAARAEGALPTGPNDPAWERSERFWIPLVGQIIVKPRWFAPAVDGVWVQAQHDGTRLALRLAWSDPSRSPDPEWDEWLGRMSQAMTTVDGALATQQGADRVLVQFSPSAGDDTERPYFLSGSSRRPVYAWRWTSNPDRVEEGVARGLGTFAASAGATGVSHAAVFGHGQWRLQLTRALAPGDTTRAPAFRTGQPIPIAFFAADGSNGEDDVRGAVSAWYAVYLDVPTPPRVYIAPVVSMLLTAGVGIVLVSQAQRRERSLQRSNLEEGR